MKCIGTSLAILLLGASLQAQTNLFIPFGQSTQEVRAFLDSRDYVVQVHEEYDMDRLRAILSPDKQVEYVFHHGELYATTVTRNYTDRRAAKQVQRNCLDYMLSVAESDIRETEENGILCFTAIAAERLIKLFVQQHAGSVTLTLTSVSRTYSPERLRRDFFYEDDILARQRPFISN